MLKYRERKARLVKNQKTLLDGEVGVVFEIYLRRLGSWVSRYGCWRCWGNRRLDGRARGMNEVMDGSFGSFAARETRMWVWVWVWVCGDRWPMEKGRSGDAELVTHANAVVDLDRAVKQLLFASPSISISLCLAARPTVQVQDRTSLNIKMAFFSFFVLERFSTHR